MSNDIYQPLVEVGPNEEAEPGTFGSAIPNRLLPKPINFAEHEDVRAWCRDQLYPILVWTRHDRANQEEEWRAIRNMNLLKHDDGRRYHGRSDAYLPVYRNNRRTLINHLSRGLFPSDEYMDATDRVGKDLEFARSAKIYAQWELEYNARLRTKIKPALGSLVDFGTSVLKIWYKKELRRVGRGVVMPRVDGSNDTIYGLRKKKVYDGLAVSPRNLFNWYIYPTTAECLDDGQIIFEDIEVPYGYVKNMERLGRWKNVDAVLSQWEIQQKLRNDTDLLDVRAGSTVPGRGLPEVGTLYPLTEVWTFMELPDAAYLADEEKIPIPVRIVLVGDIPIEVTRNPFYHQKPPYAAGRIDWEQGYFYGSGEGLTTRWLQYLANDFANQSNDNGIMALNPVSIINPGLMIGVPRPFRPGVTWWSTDVQNAVKFDRPPYEQVQFGIQMMSMYLNMAKDMMGTPDVLQGVRAEKTATGTQILQKNAGGRIQDMVEDFESEVMQVILEMLWCNAQQYRDKEVLATFGGQIAQMRPEDFARDITLRWMASSQATNSQIRAQNAIQFINAIMPVVPFLNQLGYVVDFPVLLKRIYSDGFGFKGFDEFIKPAQAMPGQVPFGQQGTQSPMAEQMGGIRQEQGDRARSALEQLGGMMGPGAEAAPGEAEDFMDVRSGADDMAAMLGGLMR